MSSLSGHAPQLPGQQYFASIARWSPGEIIFWAALLAVFSPLTAWLYGRYQ